MTAPALTLTLPPLAFTVAVTGHRDLTPAESAYVADQIKAQLASLGTKLADGYAAAQKRAPSLLPDAPPQLRFLSALAAGTDLIGAAEAQAAGWPLHMLLPFTPALHRAVMAGEGVSDDQLDAFYLLPEGVRPLRPARELDRIGALADWDEADITDPDLRSYWRARRYRTLGQILVQQADMLIAVWRGTPPEGPGGTADVIAEAMRARLPIIWIDPGRQSVQAIGRERDSIPLMLLGQDPGLACFADVSHVHDSAIAALLAPAADSNAGHHGASQNPATGWGSAASFLQRDPAGLNEPIRSRTGWCIYELFRYLLLVWCKFPSGKPMRSWPGFLVETAYLGYEFDGIAALDLHSPSVSDVDRAVRDVSIASDAIATRMGHVYRSSYILIFFYAALAVGSGLASLFFDEHIAHRFLFVELALLALAFVLVIRGRQLRWHMRWLMARHVAEALRGVRLLCWIGFGGRRPAEPDASWSVWLTNHIAAAPGIHSGAIDRAELRNIALAARAIVGRKNAGSFDQITYHDRNGMRLKALHLRLDLLGWVAVGSAAVSSLIFVLIALECFGPYEPSRVFSHWTHFAGGFGPAVAAALAAIRFQGDFERFADRSDETAAALTRISERLDDIIGGNGPLAPGEYEPLAEQILAAQAIFEQDLEDWRFVYGARPTPGL